MKGTKKMTLDQLYKAYQEANAEVMTLAMATPEEWNVWQEAKAKRDTLYLEIMKRKTSKEGN
jgi:hypothetical protein